jgi:hypothetical protein
MGLAVRDGSFERISLVSRDGVAYNSIDTAMNAGVFAHAA